MQTIQLDGLAEAQALFGEARFKKASGRAVKKALDKSATELSKTITRTWNIKKKDLSPLLHKKMDYSGDHPTGYLTARSRPLSWRLFGAKQNQKGVGVRIKKSGSRKTYLDSFWNPNLKSGGYGFTTKTGELHIRKYDVRSDAKTKRTYIPSRLPLTVRRVITVASMFEQSPTFIPVQKIAGETWQHEFLRQLTL